MEAGQDDWAVVMTHPAGEDLDEEVPEAGASEKDAQKDYEARYPKAGFGEQFVMVLGATAAVSAVHRGRTALALAEASGRWSPPAATLTSGRGRPTCIA